ncbi:hypothetical protein TNCV_2642941 [Trichonephila clavipes]|nr:hypothetical protein TNCV_2642941 [Trichonephila clavipes]
MCRSRHLTMVQNGEVVAKSPRVAEQCAVNIHLLNHSLVHVIGTGCSTETSRNITARDISGEIHYLLEDSRRFRTRQHGHRSRQIGRQK